MCWHGQTADHTRTLYAWCTTAGATTVAVLPTCTVNSASDTQRQQQQPFNIPQLPFPLELVVLAMLRVLLRRSHEGGLDGTVQDACSKVVQFAAFFRHMGQQRLKELLAGCFAHVIELPVAAVGGEQQVCVVGTITTPAWDV